MLKSKEIFQIRRQLWTALALKYSLHMLCVYSFAAGTAVLISKMLLHYSLSIFWMITGFFVCLIISCYMARKQLPNTKSIGALLDKHSRLGGLLMAGQDTQIGQWERELENLALPKIAWHGSRTITTFVVAAGFAMVCALIPQRYIGITPMQPINLGGQIDDLQKDVELLKQERVIDEVQALELEKKLEITKENSGGTDPVQAWEALDSLKQDIDKITQDAAMKTVGEIGKIAAAQNLASAISDANMSDNQSLREAMKQLAQQTEGLCKNNAALKREIGSESLNACKNGTLSPEQLKKLSESLAKCQAGKSGAIDKMCQAGMLNAEMQAMCRKSGSCNSQGLSAFLGENGLNDGSLSNRAVNSGMPGKGGVTRGRGDAPMMWGDESSEQGAAFKEKALAPGVGGGLDQSEVVGMSAISPEIGNEAEKDTSSTISASAGTGQAYKYKVLPRYKSTVKKYFERNEQK